MQLQWFEHRARHAAMPAVVVLGGVFALDDDRYGWVGRVVLLAAASVAVVATGSDLRHRWDVCGDCAAPPAAVATAAARVHLARGVHGRGRLLVRSAMALGAVAALSMAGRVHEWPVRVAVVVGAGGVLAWLWRELRRAVWHTRVRDECPVENCRAADVTQRPGRVWYRHYRSWPTLILAATTAIAALTGQGAVAERGFTWFLVVDVGMAGRDRGHAQEDLCLHCRIPQDPGRSVTRWRLVLRTCHTRWWSGLSIGLPFLALVAFLLGDHARGQLPLACSYVTMRAVMLAAESVVHAPLIPWCPGCRRDGRGWFASPDPDPDPGRHNPLPTPVRTAGV